MTTSMTGFAASDIPLKGVIARWEIKSVNHRYLEIYFRLPPGLADVEYSLRELIRNKLFRGKVECNLKLEFTNETPLALTVDYDLINQLINCNKNIADKFQVANNVSAIDLLRWPMVLQTAEKDLNIIVPELQQSFAKALDILINTRFREGEKLQQCIIDRVVKIQALLNKIIERLPMLEENYRIKCQKKINELKLEITLDKVEPIVTTLIQKMDIAEELDRLKLHLTEVSRVLTAEEVQGRRLDFLMQELNRETNTLASKIIDGQTAQDCVNIKVLIEEMREQIQNIE